MLYSVIKQDILPQESVFRVKQPLEELYAPTLSPRFGDHVDSYFYISTCVRLISWRFNMNSFYTYYDTHRL